jgi:hypothetical protein
MDSRLRGIITRSPRHEMVRTIARMLSPVGNRVEGIEFEHPEPDDFTRDFRLSFRYRIPRFAVPAAGGFEFASPMMNVVLNHGRLFRAGATSWSEKRETDVFLYYTQLIDGTETIRLPKGYSLADPPSSDEIDETYAYFKGTSAVDGRTLTITQHAEIRRRQIPSGGYGGFKKAIDEAKKWAAQSFRIEKGGAR